MYQTRWRKFHYRDPDLHYKAMACRLKGLIKKDYTVEEIADFLDTTPRTVRGMMERRGWHLTERGRERTRDATSELQSKHHHLTRRLPVDLRMRSHSKPSILKG